MAIHKRSWLPFVLLAGLFTGIVHGQAPPTLAPVDFAGIHVDLDVGLSSLEVRSQADIFSRSTFFGDESNEIAAAVSQYDLSGLNPDGIFSANFSGRVSASLQDPAGNREVAVFFYEGTGVIDAAGLSTPRVHNENRLYPEFGFHSQTPGFVDVQMDVTRELRETIRRGASHISATMQATYPQGTSTVSSAAPPVIELLEYYDDPMDALPLWNETTGLVFRGQAGEFITQGTTQVLTPDQWTFDVDRNYDNGISVQIDSIADVTLWTIELAAPDGAMLQTGDSFDAARWPFQGDGTAGFDFSGDGRGYNDLLANFTINDVAYDEFGEVLRLDVEFTQRAAISEDSFGDPLAVGQFRYNAVAVPEPSSVAIGCLIGAGVLLRRRRGGNR